MRELRADLLIARNIRALLSIRNVDGYALAAWCGHSPPWISKIISGQRGVQMKDLGKIADFFGLSVADLFQYGIDPLLERRRHSRRSGLDRRSGQDRRQTPNAERLPEIPAPTERAADRLRHKAG